MKIDIEKLICFLMSDEVIENNIPESLKLGLKEQGYKYEDGKICPLQEPVSEELEEAANSYIDNWYKLNNLDKKSYPIDVEISKNDFKAVAKEQGKEFRQEISVTGRNIDDVFRLDCVRSVVKGLDGQPLFILKDGQSAYIGDTLRENQAGHWTVKRGGA
jgi:hypothetical protein